MCQNRRFAKRIYSKVELKHLGPKGWGLIALEYITKGTFVMEYVGEVIDDEKFKLRLTESIRDRVENLYFLKLEKDRIIDSTIFGNKARFINHSCEPNCSSYVWWVNGQPRAGIFANRDIKMVCFF